MVGVLPFLDLTSCASFEVKVSPLVLGLERELECDSAPLAAARISTIRDLPGGARDAGPPNHESKMKMKSTLSREPGSGSLSARSQNAPIASIVFGLVGCS